MERPARARARGHILGDGQRGQRWGRAVRSSSTRYYLSLDPVKNAADTLLTGTRKVPGLAGGASQSGTVTVTIPDATPLNTYFRLACAGDLNVIAEPTRATTALPRRQRRSP